ncbi:MAG TPA: hypothetical protein VD789_06780 [Thermomicrobiales bacterium]|nr:hypothetical protein [Thermomicrobiales bacterium]
MAIVTAQAGDALDLTLVVEMADLPDRRDLEVDAQADRLVTVANHRRADVIVLPDAGFDVVSTLSSIHIAVFSSCIESWGLRYRCSNHSVTGN